MEEGAEGTRGLDHAYQVADHREEDLDLVEEETEQSECKELARCMVPLAMAKDLGGTAEEVLWAQWCTHEVVLVLGLAGGECCGKDDPCCHMGSVAEQERPELAHQQVCDSIHLDLQEVVEEDPEVGLAEQYPIVDLEDHREHLAGRLVGEHPVEEEHCLDLADQLLVGP